jgi:phosphate-selective porin OprO/OprP
MAFCLVMTAFVAAQTVADDPVEAFGARLRRQEVEQYSQLEVLPASYEFADTETVQPSVDVDANVIEDLSLILPHATEGDIIFAAEKSQASTGAKEPATSGNASSSPEKPKSDDPSSEDFFAGWDNGFVMKSKSGDYVIHFIGQVDSDYRDYTSPQDTIDKDGFLLRRARFGAEGVMAKHFEYRLLPEFGQNRARILDAYFNIHYWDEFQITLGKYRQPFSYEQWVPVRFLPFMERSMIDELAPARDVGVMFFGRKVLRDKMDYWVSFFNGIRDGDFETGEGKEVSGRVVFHFFDDNERTPLLYGLQIGMSCAMGEHYDDVVQPNRLRTPAAVRWFQYNSSVQEAGFRLRLSPEISYFYGPFGCASQWFYEEQDLTPTITSPLRVNVPNDGYYVMASYLLTGEKRESYNVQIKPKRPLDLRKICRNPGAWEIATRVSRLTVGDNVFDAGPAQLSDPDDYAPGATELSLSVNWYFNTFSRFMIGFEHAWFDDPVQLGNGLTDSETTFQCRFQAYLPYLSRGRRL